MQYLRVPNEIALGEIRAKKSSWSCGQYPRVIIPAKHVVPVRNLLESSDNGHEVGSLAYVPASQFTFVRTKALQDYAYLTQEIPGATTPITPQAFARATRNKPGRVVRDGDILYARGGSVGEVGHPS